MLLVSAFRLASNRLGIRLLIQISHVFAASSRVKKNPFSQKGSAEIRLNFSFSGGRFLFQRMRRPYFLSGASGNFYFFFFSNYYNVFYFLKAVDDTEKYNEFTKASLA